VFFFFSGISGSFLRGIGISVEMYENLGLGEDFVLVHFDDIGGFEVFDIVVGLDFLV